MTFDSVAVDVCHLLKMFTVVKARFDIQKMGSQWGFIHAQIFGEESNDVVSVSIPLSAFPEPRVWSYGQLAENFACR